MYKFTTWSNFTWPKSWNLSILKYMIFRLKIKAGRPGEFWPKTKGKPIDIFQYWWGYPWNKVHVSNWLEQIGALPVGAFSILYYLPSKLIIPPLEEVPFEVCNSFSFCCVAHFDFVFFLFWSSLGMCCVWHLHMTLPHFSTKVVRFSIATLLIPFLFLPPGNCFLQYSSQWDEYAMVSTASKFCAGATRIRNT